MKKTALVFCVSLLCACASTERTPEEIAAAKSTRKHCTDSAPTGSLRKVSRCRSAAQLKAEREAAQESLRNRSILSGGGGESQ
jgi:hypothetical protein